MAPVNHITFEIHFDDDLLHLTQPRDVTYDELMAAALDAQNIPAGATQFFVFGDSSGHNYTKELLELLFAAFTKLTLHLYFVGSAAVAPNDHSTEEEEFNPMANSTFIALEDFSEEFGDLLSPFEEERADKRKRMRSPVEYLPTPKRGKPCGGRRLDF